MKEKRRTTAVDIPDAESKMCFVHQSAGDERDSIRSRVCRDLPLTKHTDGNHYCVLHKPCSEKLADFQTALSKRLSVIESALDGIERLSEGGQEARGEANCYDFRYVWFPSRVDFRHYLFKSAAYFGSASFQGPADFLSASFQGPADFLSASFQRVALFGSASFRGPAYFGSASFQGDAHFESASFQGPADFLSASFQGYAYFGSASFQGDAHFGSASFQGRASFGSSSFQGRAFFISASFQGVAIFDAASFQAEVNFLSVKIAKRSNLNFCATIFHGKVSFRSAVVEGSILFEARGIRNWPENGNWLTLEENKQKVESRSTSVFEGTANFSQLEVDKPERITFNKVRLCPSWFVNIDSRKFTFTDIAWENHKASKIDLKKELIALTRRRFGKPHNLQLLTVAFRNLGANAEEFNRFEEASRFRRSACECERLERINRQKEWWKRLKKQWWCKRIYCRDVGTEAGTTISETLVLLKVMPFDFVHFLYRNLSGYGESWSRAFCWLLCIWLVFALFYWSVGLVGFSSSFGYSLMVMTIQRPEPRPSGLMAFAYALQTILGPLQGALLALAIRRKFMR